MELLPLPTNGIHILFDKLLEYLNNHLANQRYAIDIKQNKNHKKQELHKVRLQCDTCRKYIDRGKNICQTLS